MAKNTYEITAWQQQPIQFDMPPRGSHILPTQRMLDRVRRESVRLCYMVAVLEELNNTRVENYWWVTYTGGPRRGVAATWRRRIIEGVTDKNFNQPMGDYITSNVLPLIIKRTKFSSYQRLNNYNQMHTFAKEGAWEMILLVEIRNSDVEMPI
jgi:hypothetical protein